MSAVLGWWIVLGVLGVLLLYVVYAFNRLVRVRNRVDNAWSGIDVQLRRRHDLVPNLVETVRGYAAHERHVLEEVTRARTEGIDAASVESQADAENHLTRGLRRLFAVVEAYPDLKASQSFLALQEELTATESKIAYARQFYNDQVLRLNTMVESAPSNLVARAFGFARRPFFDIEDPVRGPVEVDL